MPYHIVFSICVKGTNVIAFISRTHLCTMCNRRFRKILYICIYIPWSGMLITYYLWVGVLFDCVCMLKCNVAFGHLCRCLTFDGICRAFCKLLLKLNRSAPASAAAGYAPDMFCRQINNTTRTQTPSHTPARLLERSHPTSQPKTNAAGDRARMRAVLSKLVLNAELSTYSRAIYLRRRENYCNYSK